MKKCVLILCVSAMPFCLEAQGISNGGIQTILDQLYNDMMPMCGQLIGIARLIGGFGALWYIGARIWKSIAAAEPVDVYGLLRPFVIGGCILLFPSLISLINGVLQPTVTGTSAMVNGSNLAMQKYLALKDTSTWGLGGLNPANWIREALRDLLELLYQCAAFVIDVIRTFYLIVMAIIGPIVFGLSIFDGFQHLITVWLARYINVFLWLPVANIFGAIMAKIQENMITGATVSVTILGQPFSMTDWAYLVFLLIGIVGYFTVPSVANYIVNAGGGNSLLHKVSTISSSAVKKTAGAAKTLTTGMPTDQFGDAAGKMSGNMSDNGMNKGYFKDKLSGN